MASPERYAPYKAKGKKSVMAKGVVSGVDLHEGGKTATVTIRHEPPTKPKPSKGGVFGIEAGREYPQESRHTMPAEHAKRFAVGTPAAVHVGPASEVGDTEDEGGETGGGAENEDADEAAEEDGEKATGAKGPKQAGGKGTKPKAGKSGDLIRRAAGKGAKA